VTHYQYDPNGHLTRVTAPNGAETAYQVDPRGRVTQESGPDRGMLAATYDAADQPLTHTDARGVTRTFQYDALGRLTAIAYPDGAEDVSLSYDTCPFGRGRLCTVTDAAGTTEYAYDAYGNLTAKTDTREGVAYTQTYQYDASHQRTALTLPSGRTVTYTRDGAARLGALATTVNGLAQPVLSDVRYNAAGQVVARTYGNGLTDTRRYDLQGRLTRQTLDAADETLLAYDAAGNVQSRTATTHAAAYAYDALHRLTAQTDTATTAYTYDPSGNRLSADHAGTLHPYTYQPQSNRLATLDGQALTHDPAGHLTQDAQGRTHTYNQAGRLTAVHQGATLIAAYTYGADGRRSHKRVGTAVTVFLYDPDGRLLAEAAADGTPIRDYLWHDDVPVAQIDAMGTDTLTYLHPDHLGTPRLGTDATATPVWRWEGDAFGDTPPDEDPDANGQSTTVHLRFPGQYFDAETGRHENWFRYYDPQIGRYITSDPIGLQGGLNTYGYAGENPLSNIDPTGLQVAVPIPLPAVVPRPIPFPIEPVLPIPYNFRPDLTDEEKEFCRKERKACAKICEEAMDDPDQCNVYGGSIEKCIRGCLPYICGGNRV
jgi:RHS repeat-associated protein